MYFKDELILKGRKLVRFKHQDTAMAGEYNGESFS
jgi:hypothetical protein